MTTLEELLSPLCEAIREKKQKSKQAAFNNFLAKILEAKRFYSWEQISLYINSETDSSLAVRAYKNMVLRAKKKHSQPEVINEIKGKVTPDTPISKQVEKATVNVDAHTFNDYMNVCFHNKNIAEKAIAHNVDIDTIRSWKCANFVQVSNALGNYIRNKG